MDFLALLIALCGAFWLIGMIVTMGFCVRSGFPRHPKDGESIDWDVLLISVVAWPYALCVAYQARND